MLVHEVSALDLITLKDCFPDSLDCEFLLSCFQIISGFWFVFRDTDLSGLFCVVSGSFSGKIITDFLFLL